MNAARRVKIKLEKHELKVIRFGRRSKFFCEVCQAETQHLRISQMSFLLQISEINVFRLAESRQIHWLETSEGKLMICANSALSIGK